jgi:hypothetical protein
VNSSNAQRAWSTRRQVSFKGKPTSRSIAITNPKTLKKRMRSLGYQATLPDEKPYDEEDAFFTRLFIGGVMVLHDMIVGGGIYARELINWATPETRGSCISSRS